ncbi:MAG: anti-sigma factor [Anaerolineae bacterium]|nr:anti-sigma factor [Anaerolineae bacterium]
MNTQFPTSDENTESSETAVEIDCSEALALVPAYTVGATDIDETRLVEAALFRCPEVLAEVKTYRSLKTAMLGTAPAVEPPPALRANILRAIEAEPAPVAKLAGGGRRRNYPLGWLAAAVVAALILTNAFWFSQVNRMREDQNQIAASLQQQNDLLLALSAGSAVRVEMYSPENTEDSGYATVVYDPQTRYAVLYTDRLPTLTPEQAYQLWLLQGEDRESAGVFQVKPDGTGMLVFHAGQSFDRYTAFGISVEPVAGSQFPTTPPVAVARF